ncbi:scavenger receptor cysteine-rich type 1 protein M130-like [Hippoglossus hippoglossus]|uniref:scavenger receptor cysteine-rich type 1 protein M130-like n=1 Tax=Hippoglossus hippoglossus TaxID=8267 RepID=UPI00148C56ED|nr:scavenger receptor cysteine-rich type 1 protein M130-like [Hippoglossus hippoglossus]XP_034435760.1 scavenger receptor cysteine-rich type 1 protein M130-like [Hippoglossus hippoglossus]
MVFISTDKLHFVLYLSIALLSLLPLSECGQIRLVGPTRCSGRLEVLHQDKWGTVCDDHWSIINALVVCRELDCGTALEAKKGAFFGQGKEEIWLDDVQCVGHESSILTCNHRQLGESNCGHSEDVGIVCSDNVRVLNGSNRCNGRVEVHHDGHWSRVCSSDWGENEADTLCKEINCGVPVTPSVVPHFEEAHDRSGIKTSCFGNESTIAQCKLQELEGACEDATVLCSDSKPIRLMNGTHRCSGRVEVYNEGQWGTVCDDRWGIDEAFVVCREMGCGNPLGVKYKAFYGSGQDPIWMDDVECTGLEKSLSECTHKQFGENDCSHIEDAGVECLEKLRLVNGMDQCSGRVEVFHSGRWGPICNNNWGVREATMVCKELQCGAPKKSQEDNFGQSGMTGFTSSCSGNVSTIAQCDLRESGTCDGVSLSCAGNGQYRLVNGSNRCSGRVEILQNGAWGTVCDDEWDLRNAQVVCRAMDCGTALTAKTSAYFGPGHGEIWLDDVKCIGNETSLFHCQHASVGENNCGHEEDAGVICSATIRLINGTDQCSGRVEFSHGEHWAPAYNLNWGMNEATVVCREMNCGDPVRATGSFGQGADMRGYKISCGGQESSITQCSQREYVRTTNERIEESAVQCTGSVKLTGGTTRCVGKVEFYYKGQWGTVCGESWDLLDAAVVCRQLNCGGVHKISTITEYGHSTGHTWTDQIGCNGQESTLNQCSQTPLTLKPCNITSVASVVCTGSLEVRLTNAKDQCSGRVEVRHGAEWQTVCDADWTLNKAEVVCELLECGRAVNIHGAAHFGQGKGPVVEASDVCFDNVTSLRQCSNNGFRAATCGHEHDAGAICAALLRLVGGMGECSGRVEILYKGQWGTVCDDEWELANADVVCRQLGCGHAISGPGSAHFGRGSGPIWLDNVECTGTETALTHCTHLGFGENNCGHGEDAGVICLGALQKPQISISPVSEVNWGDRVEITCTVVTEHMGGTFILKMIQGSFKMERFSENEAATFAFPAVDFSQKGSYFCEYQKKLASQVIYYPQGNTAELSVTVKLETPSISLTSPHAMVIYSPVKISVNRGSDFSITCSIHSKYPEGVFSLEKSNGNTTEMKPAFGHSVFYLAYFEFPAIDFINQGDYSCVYSVNLSSMSFISTPSKSIQVTVLASSSSSVVTGVVVSLVVLLILLVIGYLVWRRRWRGAGTIVQFSNRFGGAIKQDAEDRSNGALSGRGHNTLVNDEPAARAHSSEDKSVDVDFDNSVERVPEDLAGRVCYELEPLVSSL